jgi:hypothetical protein
MRAQHVVRYAQSGRFNFVYKRSFHSAIKFMNEIDSDPAWNRSAILYKEVPRFRIRTAKQGRYKGHWYISFSGSLVQRFPTFKEAIAWVDAVIKKNKEVF